MLLLFWKYFKCSWRNRTAGLEMVWWFYETILHLEILFFWLLLSNVSFLWCIMIVLFHSQRLHESQHYFQTLPNYKQWIFCELWNDGTRLGQKCRNFQCTSINYSHVSYRTVMCMIYFRATERSSAQNVLFWSSLAYSKEDLFEDTDFETKFHVTPEYWNQWICQRCWLESLSQST